MTQTMGASGGEPRVVAAGAPAKLAGKERRRVDDVLAGAENRWKWKRESEGTCKRGQL